MLKTHVILMSMLIVSNMDKSWKMVMITINIIMMVLMMMNPLFLKTTMISLHMMTDCMSMIMATLSMWISSLMILTSWKFKINNMKPTHLLCLQ